MFLATKFIKKNVAIKSINRWLSQKRALNTTAKVPDLTKDRYDIHRKDFATVDDLDIMFFEKTLGPRNVLTEDDAQSFNIDYCKSVRGESQVVLKPKSTEEVSAILRYCNQKKLAVCPQGGNTGLVGGSVPVFDEIILNLQRMSRVEAIDEYSNILTCQAGCVLQTLEESVNERGLTMPLDLGAKGSCQIGGNISTNAGGLRLLRYGNLHGSVLGLEVVTADGTVLDLMSNFKKDNTGYHLKNLFIGSEGTLGVITKLAIHCPQRSHAVNIAFLGMKDFQAVLTTYLMAKRHLSEILSSCEMIDAEALRMSTSCYNLQSPIPQYPFYMLIETSGSRSDHDAEKLNEFLETSITTKIVEDGTVTNELTKMKNIWQLREKIADALILNKYCFKYDISLPLLHFYDIVPTIRERLGDLATVCCGYGHIGDSNLHLNVQCEQYHPDIHNLIEPFVYEYTSKLGGSISAEHGIGFLKSKYLKYSKSAEAVQLMKQVKQLMDPKGILNPYKLLPVDM